MDLEHSINPEHLNTWHRQLADWAGNGRLLRAAQTALGLPAEHPGLESFIRSIGSGDFSNLPEIRLLDWDAMDGIPCAYCERSRQILLNQDWIENALEEQVVAVLSEQLGHHLDALFNETDTPGDEGELFLECLRQEPSSELIESLRHASDHTTLTLDGETIEIEESGAGAHCLDLRDLH